jgi:hypothetical protein
MDWHVKIWYKDDAYNSLINLAKPDFIEVYKKNVLSKIYVNYIITADLEKQEVERIVEDFFLDNLLEDYEVSKFKGFSFPKKIGLKNAIVVHVVLKKEVINPNDNIILRAINVVYKNKVKDLRSFLSYVFSKEISKEEILNRSYKLIANRLLHDLILEEA